MKPIIFYGFQASDFAGFPLKSAHFCGFKTVFISWFHLARSAPQTNRQRRLWQPPLPAVFLFPALDRVLQTGQTRRAWSLFFLVLDQPLHPGAVTASPYGGFRSRSSNRAASLNAPVNNSSAICGSPRIFRRSDSIMSANLLFGRGGGSSFRSICGKGFIKYAPQLGHFNNP